MAKEKKQKANKTIQGWEVTSDRGARMKMEMTLGQPCPRRVKHRPREDTVLEKVGNGFGLLVTDDRPSSFSRCKLTEPRDSTSTGPSSARSAPSQRRRALPEEVVECQLGGVKF